MNHPPMKHVALLRAINVGTKNRVKMTDLVVALQAAGLVDATTYLQTGNILFDDHGETTDSAKAMVHAALATLGITTCAIVRSASHMSRIVDAQPFDETDDVKPGHRFVTFLDAPAQELASRSPAGDVEVVKQTSTEVYHVFRIPTDYVGAPKPFVDAKIKVASTTRNWTVVKALAELLNA